MEPKVNDICALPSGLICQLIRRDGLLATCKWLNAPISFTCDFTSLKYLGEMRLPMSTKVDLDALIMARNAHLVTKHSIRRAKKKKTVVAKPLHPSQLSDEDFLVYIKNQLEAGKNKGDEE